MTGTSDLRYPVTRLPHIPSQMEWHALCTFGVTGAPSTTPKHLQPTLLSAFSRSYWPSGYSKICVDTLSRVQRLRTHTDLGGAEPWATTRGMTSTSTSCSCFRIQVTFLKAAGGAVARWEVFFAGGHAVSDDGRHAAARPSDS
jgi:hypothetical protein